MSFISGPNSSRLFLAATCSLEYETKRMIHDEEGAVAVIMIRKEVNVSSWGTGMAIASLQSDLPVFSSIKS
jgi:hypothetical protein